MSDRSKVTLKWPLINGILQQSDTTYLDFGNDKAMYIDEIYKRRDGQNTKVTKGIYPDGYRFIDIITGGNAFTQGYRPDGSINYTILPEEYENPQKEKIPKGYNGMQVKRALNFFNPLTWPSRIAATLPKDAPEGTKFPAIVVDKKSQTLRYYDENGKQQLSSIVSTGVNKGDITAKSESKTPEGNFTIGSKTDNVKEGVFGDNLFMSLSGTSNSGFKLNGRGFGIHGDTNRPFQLGRNDSHGCVRVENKNLDKLYNLVQPGTNVYIRKKGGNIKLIPKGKKGWYASEMQAWSPEKIKQVLKQYGKEGLSKATYAYLTKRIGKEVDPTYLYQNDFTNSNLTELQFKAASLGIQNAYGITSEQELQKAIQSKQDAMDKEAAKLQVNKQQQAQYEDIWARKNYKAITGQDWHAGIDLSDYTMSAIRKLQKEIGTTVDGKWGDKSQQAYDAYKQKQQKQIQTPLENKSQTIQTLTTGDTPQENYWELVKDNPDFAQWLYTSGGQGTGRRLANLINVGGNYVTGMLNPDGKTVFNLGQGLQRQAVAAALYGQQNGISGITDRTHSALGGLSGNHSGEEFRENTSIGGYFNQAMSSPYHNVYGQSADARFTERGFESVGDNYTYNNMWVKDKTGKNVVKVMGDGEGDATLGESYQAYKKSRESGNGIKAAMETAATVRGVNTSRHPDVSFVPQETLEEWAKEYYLSHNPSNKSVTKSQFGGMLKHITGY